MPLSHSHKEKRNMRKITVRISDESFAWLQNSRYDGSVSGLAGMLIDKLADPKQRSGHIRAWLSQILR